MTQERILIARSDSRITRDEIALNQSTPTCILRESPDKVLNRVFDHIAYMNLAAWTILQNRYHTSSGDQLEFEMLSENLTSDILRTFEDLGIQYVPSITIAPPFKQGDGLSANHRILFSYEARVSGINVTQTVVEHLFGMFPKTER